MLPDSFRDLGMGCWLRRLWCSWLWSRMVGELFKLSAGRFLKLHTAYYPCLVRKGGTRKLVQEGYELEPTVSVRDSKGLRC